MVAVSFIGGGNQEYLEKTTDLPQSTDLYQIMTYLINHVGTETMITGRMIPSGTNTPSAVVST
jgi:hypothetical protein